MASRGQRNKIGVVTTTEYSTVPDTDYRNSSVIVGNNGNHGLPDYSHTPNRIYIKIGKTGFREMRVYDGSGKAIFEIGYHPEKNLTGNRTEKVLHYHAIGNKEDPLFHQRAHPMTEDVYGQYKAFLNRWGIFWHE